MGAAAPRLQEVEAAALQLAPADRLRLIERLAASLFGMWVARREEPSRSTYGMCADLGPAPSAEEIDEARREAWANFPRERFYE